VQVLENLRILFIYCTQDVAGVFAGNRIGDVCESDLDQDGAVNNLDVCPKNKDISSMNFTEYTSIDLNPTLTSEKAPVWHTMDKGREVRQIETTLKPAAYIGLYVALFLAHLS
jgi:hypothetical protein